MNDLIGFIVALVAVKVSEQPQTPRNLAFGWQRSQLLGAFFNGVFLLALGVSILLQSIERFVALQHVENPKLVLIVGCIGLTLNIISASFLHEHEHEPPATGAFEDDNRNALRRVRNASIYSAHVAILIFCSFLELTSDTVTRASAGRRKMTTTSESLEFSST